jgi:hypothetical protein
MNGNPADLGHPPPSTPLRAGFDTPVLSRRVGANGPNRSIEQPWPPVGPSLRA